MGAPGVRDHIVRIRWRSWETTGRHEDYPRPVGDTHDCGRRRVRMVQASAAVLAASRRPPMRLRARKQPPGPRVKSRHKRKFPI
jgi:hypothetical protein